MRCGDAGGTRARAARKVSVRITVDSFLLLFEGEFL
jgi:hypothetical protein